MDNSVFISYRQSAGGFIARAVYQNLEAHGYDVFWDVESIGADEFGPIILNQIAARPYFLVILTPGTLERCVEADDWLLHEIKHAVSLKRRIVLLHTPHFKLDELENYLPKRLASKLRGYNDLEVSYRPKYFEVAMEDLRTRFLKPVNIPTTPTPNADKPIVERKRRQAAAEPPVTQRQLSAQEYFERALARKADDFDGKIADYTEAIRLNPQFARAYGNRGNTRFDKGDVDGAITDYNEIMRLDPHYALAFHHRGFARQAKGDLDGAIEDYNEAIRLDPEYAVAYFNRGNARQDQGNLDSAIEDYNEAIRLNPWLVLGYNNRGNARRDQGNLDSAIEDYNEAIRLNPRFALSYNNRGIARQDQGDLDEAIADYTEAIHLNPEYVDAYFNRGYVRNVKGDVGGAIKDYNTVIRLAPANHVAYNNRAEIHFELQHYQDALSDFQTAIELKPDHPFHIAGLAITLHVLGQQVQEAKRLWQTLLAKDERYRDADWVDIKLNWAPPLTKQARKLISEL